MTVCLSPSGNFLYCIIDLYCDKIQPALELSKLNLCGCRSIEVEKFEKLIEY